MIKGDVRARNVTRLSPLFWFWLTLQALTLPVREPSGAASSHPDVFKLKELRFNGLFVISSFLSDEGDETS